MAKDKASGSAGGSRAAKKRRKLKDKVPPAAVRGTASQQVAPLSKESHHQHPTTSARTSSKAENRPLSTSSTADNAREGIAGTSNGKSNSGNSGGRRARVDDPTAAIPVVIDVSTADERSRILLELDAEGVLSDPDVESGLKARQLLQWMVAPLPVEEFYETYWERNAFVVRGRRSDYFTGWLDTSDIESFISGQSMQYGTDLDVTNYVNKRRITLNPSSTPSESQRASKQSSTGKTASGARKRSIATVAAESQEGGSAGGGAVVTPNFVWEKFRQGCSLRMPCPQKYSDPLHRLLSALEEEFGCMVGSNVYLTPPRSQGFAPHWDDIEAFLLQVEGRKRWRVYAPANEDAALPRLSSPNLEDKGLGEPALEVVLEPGDILYFPRGWVHQAETVGDEASLHITISAMQGNCWADLVEGLVPQAVASAIQGNKELRGGLPRDYLEYMGVVHSDVSEDSRREGFKKRMRKHLGVIVEEALELIDAAADQMGKRYISDRLPPVLEETEEASSVLGRGDTPITPLSRLRLARRGCARLVLEDGVAVVYHCMDNSRVHHGNALSPLQFELDDAPAIEVLLAAYPHPVTVADLPHPPTEDLEDKVGIASSLYKDGFLLVVEDDDEDGDDDDDDNNNASSNVRGDGVGFTSQQQQQQQQQQDVEDEDEDEAEEDAL